MSNMAHSYETIIIGGGQAGLATGYYLKQQGQDLGEGVANWLSYNTARYDKELKFTEVTYVKTK